MSDEFTSKRLAKLKKRLEEYRLLTREYMESGKYLPEEIRIEYTKLEDEFNEIVLKQRKQASKEFLEEIFKEMPE